MSIVKAQFCISNEPFHQVLVPSRSQSGVFHTVTCPFPDDPPERWYCSCEGWKFRGRCSHCASVDPCRWSSVVGPETQTKQQEHEQTCPRCGGPTYEDLVEDHE